MQAFHEWLQAQMDERGWSQSELHRQSDIDTGTISNLLNQVRKPGPEICRALAKALRIPQKVVFVHAGLMDELDPNEPSFTERAWEAINLFLAMDDEAQQDEVTTLRARVERRKRGSSAADPSPSGSPT